MSRKRCTLLEYFAFGVERGEDLIEEVDILLNKLVSSLSTDWFT
jgi:hypothetical protein